MIQPAAQQGYSTLLVIDAADLLTMVKHPESQNSWDGEFLAGDLTLKMFVVSDRLLDELTVLQ